MVRRHVPEDATAALAAFALDLDQLRRQVRDLTGLRVDIAAHSRALESLSRFARKAEAGGIAPPPDEPPDDRADNGTGGPGDPSEPLVIPIPEWLTVTDPALAVAWLTGLTHWVPRVWTRYPGAGLQPCWPWHPAIVAELLVVQHAWDEAVLPGQSVLALAAWHDRWRPAAMHRINRAMTGCDRGAGCHVDIAGHHFRFDLSRLDELAAWWAETDRADVDAAPGLTREERHEDRRYARERTLR